ncbi:MAG TPA: tetratricopeptide repeat protein [Methanoculleus sp.]|nr:tetratricopeptide repeat protein [Methanoculleus sp.]
MSKRTRTEEHLVLTVVVLAALCCSCGCTQQTAAMEWYRQGLHFNAYDNQFEQALECFNTSLELDPQFEGAWLGKSVALYNLKRYQDALQSVDRALELDPEYAMAWSMKGEILSSLGKPDEADRCYARAQEIDPRFVRV